MRAACPDLSAELDAVVGRMMALRPEDRYAEPGAVMQALLPFVRTATGEQQRLDRPVDLRADAGPHPRAGATPPPEVGQFRVLVVDDESAIRDLCRQLLAAEGAVVETAANGTQGLAMALKGKYDLVLLDVAMPDMTGVDVLQRLRQQGKDPNLKVLMFSGHITPEEMSDMLSRGADDFLTKPFSVSQLIARVQNLLRLKAAQDRAARLNRHLAAANAELERDLADHAGDAEAVRNALVLAVARIIEQREGRGTGHPVRMQRYCRTLAEAAAALPAFDDRIDARSSDLLECCAPLARHRPGRAARPRPAQGRPARPGRADGDGDAHDVRGGRPARGDARDRGREGVPDDGRGHGPAPPRAARRDRVPGPAGRGRDPAGRPVRGPGRRLRRPPLPAAVQAGPAHTPPPSRS